MKIQRNIAEPIRELASWDERWKGFDLGLITCWELGREKALEDKNLADSARAGQLIPLAWKGGVQPSIALKKKYGTYFYLAMWQGLRGDNLDIDLHENFSITCTLTDVVVVFTSDQSKFLQASF